MNRQKIDEEVLNDLRIEIDRIREEMKTMNDTLKSARIKSDIDGIQSEIFSTRHKLKDLLKKIQKFGS
jgi:predicted  nucleic acid-binding Zn-ribbon protein